MSNTYGLLVSYHFFNVLLFSSKDSQLLQELVDNECNYQIVHQYHSHKVKGQEEETDPLGLRRSFETNLANQTIVNQKVEENLSRFTTARQLVNDAIRCALFDKGNESRRQATYIHTAKHVVEVVGPVRVVREYCIDDSVR